MTYAGAARIIVPTVRTQINKGEALHLKVIVLDRELAESGGAVLASAGQRQLP